MTQTNKAQVPSISARNQSLYRAG